MNCKLANENDQTKKGTQWGEGVTHETSGEGDLCGPGWLHYYEDPLLAVLHNPIHGVFNPSTMHLWEIVAEGVIKKDGQMKAGCSKMTTVRRIEIPSVTMEQRVKYAILCALEVCQEPLFVAWANKWLSGEDRSARSAESAAESAWSAWSARSVWSARSAWSAAESAWSAVESARVTRVTRVARVAAARSARSAEAAAQAAEVAEAVSDGKSLDLISIARKAMEK